MPIDDDRTGPQDGRAAIDDLLDQPPDEHGRRGRARRVLRRWMIVLLSLITALVVGVGAIAFYGVQTLNTVKREPGLLPSGRLTVDPGQLDPARLLAVVNRLSRSVTLDDTLGNDRVLGLVKELQVTSGQDVEQLQVPVAGFGTSSAGASYVKPDKPGIARLGEALSSGRMGSYRD